MFGTDKLIPIRTVLTLTGSQLKEQASQTEQAGVAKRNQEQRKANLQSLNQEMEPQTLNPFQGRAGFAIILKTKKVGTFR